MADFARLDKNERKYPIKNFDGQDNQSYGFLDARKVQTGTLRGAQTIANTDGAKIVLGKIAGTNDFGIAFYDATGVLISAFTGTELVFYDSNKDETLRITGTTLFMTDPTTGFNRLQIGKLPDDSYDVAISDAGTNVADAF